MLYKWAGGIPNGSIMFTTGGPTAITADPTLIGSAGNVLSAFHKDIRKINLCAEPAKCAKNLDRYGLLDENMADQIFDSLKRYPIPHFYRSRRPDYRRVRQALRVQPDDP